MENDTHMERLIIRCRCALGAGVSVKDLTETLKEAGESVEDICFAIHAARILDG